MSSLLDIDLDYFNLAHDPLGALSEILGWANRPVDVLAENHTDALRYWVKLVDSGRLPRPTHILHADEHHDIMDQKDRMNLANVMYHAMVRWRKCRVYWMAQESVDTPGTWLAPETWSELKSRFRMGTKRPPRWPKPDFVSVTVSPAFVPAELQDSLVGRILAEQKKWSNQGATVFRTRRVLGIRWTSHVLPGE